MMQPISIGLIIAGIFSYFSPGFNGIFFERSEISVGEGRILSAVLFIGGLILYAISKRPSRS